MAVQGGHFLDLYFWMIFVRFCHDPLGFDPFLAPPTITALLVLVSLTLELVRLGRVCVGGAILMFGRIVVKILTPKLVQHRPKLIGVRT